MVRLSDHAPLEATAVTPNRTRFDTALTSACARFSYLQTVAPFLSRLMSGVSL